MDIIVSRHAKRRIKQRVHKNWEKAANDALMYGLRHGELKGRLKKHLDWMALRHREFTSYITEYKVYNGSVYLFSGNVLVTVIHLPSSLARMANRQQQ